VEEVVGMVVEAAKVAQFEGLFKEPSVESMLELNWSEFQDFVQYVFECAGYVVEYVADRRYPFGPGVDLNLHVGSIQDPPFARVEVRHYDPGALLTFGDVAAFLGILNLGGGAPGYLVTTSDFNGPARAAAAAAPIKVHLINGSRLVRYIKYVGGSRLDRIYTGSKSALTQPTDPNWLEVADALVARTPRPPDRPTILAIANNKGGVGKTTTARYLGLGMAERGMRVLLVDMDPQTNLGEFVLGEDFDNGAEPNLAGYFAGQYPLANAIRSVPEHPNLSIIPAHRHLSRMDTGGSGRPDVELKFAADLYDAVCPPSTEAHEHYDWVLLDTPPAISLFTRAALGVADCVLAPARARRSSHHGVDNMVEVRTAMDALMGREPAILGCVVTHWAQDRTSQTEWDRLEALFHGWGSEMFATKIPMAVAIEANSHLAWHALQAYSNLVEEVLNHANNHH
jgi:chromosome partitioning protein